MFFFSLTYIKPLDEVEKFLDKHNHYLETFYKKGNFVFSGRKKPRTGGVILCKAPTLQEAEKIYHNDPFYKEGIAKYSVIEFEPTKSNEIFKKIIGHDN
ncbi:YciI family protein [Liquorilactobacillus aquaticus]|uniref:YciI family protein n=1 Tax=Liquorilactobacillus aquaticus TaxID=392566 RepID=UPI00070CC6F5|nr:YciI family protein [Liquorilactobacillus aquaticus]